MASVYSMSIVSAFENAAWLMWSLDKQLIEIVTLSLRVSLLAVLIAAVIGLPSGAFLAVSRFRGRSLVLIVLNAMLGLPPVVVGLAVYFLLSRAGPLGSMGLLYTPEAMIIAQGILVTPIIAALTRQTVEDMYLEYSEQLRIFGIGKLKSMQILLWDGRYSLITALLAGFGRAIAEVGAVIIVGGNINHLTRVMTTTITLETSKGNLDLALGLGIVLVAIAIGINTLVMALRYSDPRHSI